MLKKILHKSFIKLLSLVLLISFTTHKQIKPIPPLKGLFTILKNDVIGFGQALLESNFIKNVYIYAKKDDPLKILIKALWVIFEEKKEAPKEEEKLVPTKSLIPTALIGNTFTIERKTIVAPYKQMAKGDMFGKLMAYIYTGKIFRKDKNELINSWNNSINTLLGKQKKPGEKQTKKEKKLEKEQKKQIRKIINKIINAIENIEKNGTYPPRTTESVLWAFFNQKLTVANITKQEKIDSLKLCIQEISTTNILTKPIDQLEKEEFFSENNLYKPDTYLNTEKTLSDIKKEGEKDFEEKKKTLKEKISQLKKIQQELKPQIDEKIKKSNKIFDEKITNLSNEIKKILKEAKIRVKDLKKLKEEGRHQEDKYKKISIEHKTAKKIYGKKIEQLKKIKMEKKEAKKTLKKPLKNIFEKWDKYDIEINRGPRQAIASSQNKLSLQNYDLYLHSLLKRISITQLPPQITQGQYGYEYKEGKIRKPITSCFESSLLDLFSILWYNPKTQKYDDTLLPDQLVNGTGFMQLKNTLRTLYQANKHNIPEEAYQEEFNGIRFPSIKRLKKILEAKGIGENTIRNTKISEIGPSYITKVALNQEWMNIISGLETPDIKYKKAKEKYEIRSTKKNLIKLCNYFYGLNVKNVEDLNGRFDKTIGDLERKITFRLEKGEGEKKIIVNITHTKDDQVIIDNDIYVVIQFGHSYVYSPARDMALLVPYEIPESPYLFAEEAIKILVKKHEEQLKKDEKNLEKRIKAYKKKDKKRHESLEKRLKKLKITEVKKRQEILLSQKIATREQILQFKNENERIQAAKRSLEEFSSNLTLPSLTEEFPLQHLLSFFSLLTSEKLLDSTKGKTWPQSMLSLLYYSLSLINPEIKRKVLEHILNQYDKVPQNIKHLMYAITQRLKESHELVESYKIVFDSEKYKVDKKLEEYLRKNPLFAIIAAIYCYDALKHLKWLKENEFDINATDIAGNTAPMLIVSTLFDLREINNIWRYLYHLQESGADFTIQNKKGETLLSKAIGTNFNHPYHNILEKILKRLKHLPPEDIKKLIEATNEKGQTALEHAKELHENSDYKKETKKIIKLLEDFIEKNSKEEVESED